MCESRTLAVASVLFPVQAFALAAKGGLTAYTTYQAGEAEADRLKAERDQALQAAADARDRGTQQEAVVRAEGTRAVGEAKVAAAASGVDTGSGSALDMLADTRAMSELDALTIRNNAAREAWGYRTAAANLEAARKNAKRQGRLGAAASFLSSAADVASVYGARKGKE